MRIAEGVSIEIRIGIRLIDRQADRREDVKTCKDEVVNGMGIRRAESINGIATLTLTQVMDS